MKQIHLSTYVIIALVLVFAVVIRILFSVNQPNALMGADSVGYYQLGTEMLQNPSPETVINEFRTPFYPLFLASISTLSGFNGPDIFSQLFEPVGKRISDIQSVLGIIGVILFISLLLRMGFSNTYILILSLLTAGNILVFYWERSLMTEGLATTTLLMSLVLFAHALKIPTTKNYVYLWISYVINFLLRPAFILLPFVTIPFLFLAVKKQTEKTKIIIMFLVSFLIPLIYVAGNSVYHGYRGIQHVGDIDALGRILELNIPVDGGTSYTFFYENVEDYRRRGGGFDAFRFIDYYDPSIYTNTARLNELQAFTQKIILHNLPLYTTKALSTIPQALTDRSPYIEIVKGPVFHLYMFFSGLFELYSATLPFALFVFPLYPIALYLVIRKKSIKRILLAAIGSVIICQICVTVFVVYRLDYGRLFAPLLPLILVFIVGTLQELLQIKKGAG